MYYKIRGEVVIECIVSGVVFVVRGIYAGGYEAAAPSALFHGGQGTISALATELSQMSNMLISLCYS